MDSSTLIYLGILALAPCLAIMVYIYWKDKFDKEPLKVLIITFLLGALSALPVDFAGFYDSLPKLNLAPLVSISVRLK
jgi:RsiW-degrading membrane proteinase PrsW (M82 family)